RKPKSTRAGAPVTACACSTVWSRNITSDDRSPVLPFAEHVGGERAAAAAREIARARLARGGASVVAGTCRCARCASVDPSRRFVPATRHLARGRRAGPTDHPGGGGGQSERCQCSFPDRQCRTA